MTLLSRLPSPLSLSPSMSAPKQPESPVVGAIKGLWGQTSKLTVTVASNVAEALGKSLGQNTPNKKSTVGSPNGLSAEWVGDVQTEYARPFTTGSPSKKSAAEADQAEFSDFSYWRTNPAMAPLDSGVVAALASDAAEAVQYNEANFWKAPQPTLEQLNGLR